MGIARLLKAGVNASTGAGFVVLAAYRSSGGGVGTGVGGERSLKAGAEADGGARFVIGATLPVGDGGAETGVGGAGGMHHLPESAYPRRR